MAHLTPQGCREGQKANAILRKPRQTRDKRNFAGLRSAPTTQNSTKSGERLRRGTFVFATNTEKEREDF